MAEHIVTTSQDVFVDDESTITITEIPIRFRNYQPYDHKLKKLVVADDHSNYRSTDQEQTESGAPIELDVIKRELALLKSDEINIVPKKNNFDLKNQVEKRLSKLKRRTQQAIVEILREKLAEQNDESSDDDQ